MFTGIITDLGTISARETLEEGCKLTIHTAFDMAQIPLGASIACDGICLTVIEKSEKAPHWFTIEASPETMDRTTLQHWQAGRKINLERPVQAGGEFGGHFVTGHVDALGEVQSFEHQGDFWLLVVQFPAAMQGMVAPKGSITVNGVSLTVNEVENQTVHITIIPHTADQTNLGQIKAGDAVNLEVDLIARYVANFLENRG